MMRDTSDKRNMRLKRLLKVSNSSWFKYCILSRARLNAASNLRQVPFFDRPTTLRASSSNEREEPGES